MFTSVLSINAQSLDKVSYVKWSNPMVFRSSPSPVVTGNGALSDSLLAVFDVQSVYEYNNEYFLINSWADYYEWYTSKFWFQFEMPELYHAYYNAGDDFGMANFIVQNFKGRYYPSEIMITCEEQKPLACWSPKRVPSKKNKEKVNKYRSRIEKQGREEIQAQARRSKEVINSETMYPINFNNSTSNLKSRNEPGEGAIQKSSRRRTSTKNTSRGSSKSSVTSRTDAIPAINRSGESSGSRTAVSNSAASRSSSSGTTTKVSSGNPRR